MIIQSKLINDLVSKVSLFSKFIKLCVCMHSGINAANYAYNKLIGQNVQGFCHANDKQQLLKHHKEGKRAFLSLHFDKLCKESSFGL